MIKTIFHTPIDLFNEIETAVDMKIPHIVSKDYGEYGLGEKYVMEAGPFWLGCEMINENGKEEVLGERMIYLSYNIIYPNFYKQK